jgi:hypothetical protein
MGIQLLSHEMHSQVDEFAGTVSNWAMTNLVTIVEQHKESNVALNLIKMYSVKFHAQIFFSFHSSVLATCWHCFLSHLRLIDDIQFVSFSALVHSNHRECHRNQDFLESQLWQERRASLEVPRAVQQIEVIDW